MGFARFLRSLAMMVLCVTRAEGKEAKRMDKSAGRAVQCRDKPWLTQGRFQSRRGGRSSGVILATASSRS